MDAKLIIILVLVGYMVFWYNNPEKGKDILEQGVDKAQSLINNARGISSNTTTECPTQYNPVCANNTEFDNSCLAQRAGFMNMTLGVCQTDE